MAAAHIPAAMRTQPLLFHVARDSWRPMGNKQKGNIQPVYFLSWAHLPLRRAHAFVKRLTLGSS
jgi:hypothetical protein